MTVTSLESDLQIFILEVIRTANMVKEDPDSSFVFLAIIAGLVEDE